MFVIIVNWCVFWFFTLNKLINVINKAVGGDRRVDLLTKQNLSKMNINRI